jgi:hypothetical protein
MTLFKTPLVLSKSKRLTLPRTCIQGSVPTVWQRFGSVSVRVSCKKMLLLHCVQKGFPLLVSRGFCPCHFLVDPFSPPVCIITFWRANLYPIVRPWKSFQKNLLKWNNYFFFWNTTSQGNQVWEVWEGSICPSLHTCKHTNIHATSIYTHKTDCTAQGFQASHLVGLSYHIGKICRASQPWNWGRFSQFWTFVWISLLPLAIVI